MLLSLHKTDISKRLAGKENLPLDCAQVMSLYGISINRFLLDDILAGTFIEALQQFPGNFVNLADAMDLLEDLSFEGLEQVRTETIDGLRKARIQTKPHLHN